MLVEGTAQVRLKNHDLPWVLVASRSDAREKGDAGEEDVGLHDGLIFGAKIVVEKQGSSGSL